VLFRPRVPTVFTAHDLLPRRTARKLALWQELLSRFDRVVVHSERGRQTLAGLGVDAWVIPHPVFPSDPPRTDDGRTLLCLGTVRPYKGLADAIKAARQIEGAKLLVAGDPLEPMNGYRAQAGDLAEWRLGYLPQSELERALGEATVALFPYLRACPRSPTTSAESGSRWNASARDASCHPETSAHLRQPRASCSTTPARSRRRAKVPAVRGPC